MLCKRLVVVLTLNNGVLTRTKKFLPPDYFYTKNFVDAWDVDELVILDVTRGEKVRENFLQTVLDISDEAFVPITVGSAKDLDEVDRFFDCGADKIAINGGALKRPELITEVAKIWGSQAVVLSIDAKDGEVFSHCGTVASGISPVDWAKEGVERGAGEILLSSIERDGSLQGYDLDLLKSVTEAVSVPVMILGGAGSWQHFVDGANAGADAVCTQIIHHFTGNSIAAAKAYMADKGVNVRSSVL